MKIIHNDGGLEEVSRVKIEMSNGAIIRIKEERGQLEFMNCDGKVLIESSASNLLYLHCQLD